MKFWPLLLLWPLSALSKIEDNSFLLNEAFTQDRDVIQVIQHYESSPEYVFTSEFPLVPSQQQLNTTLTSGEKDDFNLNYILQTKSLPYRSVENLGLYTDGADFIHVLSFDLTPEFMHHWNIGFSLREERSFLIGTSLVYLVNDSYNWLVEMLLEDESSTTLTLNPGARFRLNLDWKKTEVTPGISFPITIQKKDPVEFGVFLYLSFESDFKT